MSPLPPQSSRRPLILATMLATWVTGTTGCRQLLGIEERETADASEQGKGGTGGGTSGAGGASGRGGKGGAGGDAGMAGESGAAGDAGASGATMGGAAGKSGAAGKGGAAGKAGNAGSGGAPIVCPAPEDPEHFCNSAEIACGEVVSPTGKYAGCPAEKCAVPANNCLPATDQVCVTSFGKCVSAGDTDCGPSSGASELGIWPMERYCATGISRGRFLVATDKQEKLSQQGTPVSFEAAAADKTTPKRIVTAPIVGPDGSVLVVTEDGRLTRLPPTGTTKARSDAFKAGAGHQDPLTTDGYPSLTLVQTGDAAKRMVLSTHPAGGPKLYRFNASWAPSVAGGIALPTDLGDVANAVYRFGAAPVVTGSGVWLPVTGSSGNVTAGGLLLIPAKQLLDELLPAADVVDDYADSGDSGVAVFDEGAKATWAVGLVNGAIKSGVVKAPTPEKRAAIPLDGTVQKPVSTPILIRLDGKLHAVATMGGKLYDVDLEAKISTPIPVGDTVSVRSTPALRRDGTLVVSGTRPSATTAGSDAIRLEIGRKDGAFELTSTAPVPNGDSVFPTILGTRLKDPKAEIGTMNPPIGETLFAAEIRRSKIQEILPITAANERGEAFWIRYVQTKPVSAEGERIYRSPALGANGAVLFTGTNGLLYEIPPPPQ